MHNSSRRRFLQLASTGLAGVCLPSAWTEEGKFLEARAVTRGPKHHFFGYYDKCPWDATGRYLLGMENDFCDRQPEPGEALTVGMIDLKDNNRYISLDKTTAWSWQQGTMLQWMGSAPESEIIYNQVEEDRYISTVRNVRTGKTRALPLPIYAISSDGKQAVTLDYDRLHRLRPGYGYCALPEKNKDDHAPANMGIRWMDLSSGENRLIIPIARAAANRPDERFRGAYHWFNHLQFNPSGSHFLFLHRWKLLDRSWWTRLYTAKPDGSELRLVWDHGMVSHFDWRDDHTILAWARNAGRQDAFFLYDLKTDKATQVGADVLTRDGHCSYSPDRKWILNDTYPDRERLQTLMLYRVADGRRFDLNRFYLSPRLTGPVRCDLHPRWNRDGTQVCVDSAHDGTRQLYVIDVSGITRG